VVITAPDGEWAEQITRELIEHKLVARGHQFQIQATYTWQGKTESNAETRVALHTRQELVDQISSYIVERHPYDVPCVIALPILAATDAYHHWVTDVTTRP